LFLLKQYIWQGWSLIEEIMFQQQPITPQLILISSILPGQVEAWRRFIQEIVNGQGEAHAASRQEMQIRQERIWIHEMAGGAMVMFVIEAEWPETVLRRLATSERPFDQWFRQQILALLGHDLTVSVHKLLPDLLFGWQSG
jgi:hypothetical protein